MRERAPAQWRELIIVSSGRCAKRVRLTNGIVHGLVNGWLDPSSLFADVVDFGNLPCCEV